MSGDTGRPAERDLVPPVAEDDFPEFAEPPRHKPPADALRESPGEAEDNAQGEVDDVIARLRRERAEGKR